MNAGVAAPVRPVAAPVSAEVGRVSEPQTRATEATSRVQEVREKDAKPLSFDPVIQADKLFKMAKKDGVDRALDDFAKDEDAKQDKELSDPLKVRSEAKENKPTSILERKVADLGERVRVLSEQNENLTERLTAAENLSRATAANLYAAAEILRALIDREEDGEEKENLLVILAKLMAGLMKMMFVPDEEDGINDGETALDRNMRKIAQGAQAA